MLAASRRGCTHVRAVDHARAAADHFGAARTVHGDALPAEWQRGPPAFVFDVDGVLLKGARALPGARAALARLWRPDRAAPAVPVVFLTNGGGVTEAAKAAQLSAALGVAVAPHQVVLSHTPLRAPGLGLLPALAHAPVLVSGRARSLAVARAYGFAGAVHTRELAAAAPAAVPFVGAPHLAAAAAEEDGHSAAGEPPPRAAVAPHAAPPGSAANPFRAVLCLTDPGNWYLDGQLILDVVLGRGVLAPRAAGAGAPPRAADDDDRPHVPVVFSHGDLVWSNEWHAPRLGLGAFRAALDAWHAALTGRGGLPAARALGKPGAEAFAAAEAALAAQAAAARAPPRFCAVFVVGDNPAVDVRGAAAHAPLSKVGPWVSLLVRTGVFSGGAEGCAVDRADACVADVAAAVDAALHRARAARWHAAR